MCRHSRTWAAEALREWQGTGYGIKRKSAGAHASGPAAQLPPAHRAAPVEHPSQPGAGPRVATQPMVVPAESASRPSSENGFFVAAGGTGEQMIVVLDGTRDAPGAWRLMSSSGGLLVRRQPWLQGRRSVRVSSGTPVMPRVTVS
jgi:hypothetical protein